MSISLKQLTYFIRVAEAGSFTAAADDMRISQPAISKQIGLLEDAFGIRMLSRHSRGVEVTPAGSVVLSHGREIVRRFSELEKDLCSFREDGSRVVELGVTPMVGRLLVNKIIERSVKVHRNLRINIHQGYSDDLMRKLVKGEIDLTFAPERGDESTTISTPLFDESFFLVGPPNLIGGSSQPIAFNDAVAYPLNLERSHHRFHSSLRMLARANNVTLNTALEMDEEHLRIQMLIELNHCTISPLGLCTREVESGQLCARLITEPRIDRTVFIVARRSHEAKSYQCTIIDTTSEIAAACVMQGQFGWRKPSGEPCVVP